MNLPNDVDETVALILVQEGFSSIEEIAYVPAGELVAVEEFDEGDVRPVEFRVRTFQDIHQESRDGLGAGVVRVLHPHQIEGMDGQSSG